MSGIFDLFTSASSKEDKDLTPEAIAALAREGIIDPRVYDPNLRFVQPSNPISTAPAYVETAKPEVVNLRKPSFRTLWEDPLKATTLAHEVEHSLVKTGGAGLKDTTRGDILLDNYAALTGRKVDQQDPKYYSPLLKLFERAANPEIRSYLKSKYNVTPGYLGTMLAERFFKPGDYEEVAADLGAIMKISKKDLYADPFLQKKLFNNDPYLMEAVRSTLHVEPRLDAKDPERLTAYKENVERYKKLLQQTEKNAKGGAINLPENYRKGGRARMI